METKLAVAQNEIPLRLFFFQSSQDLSPQKAAFDFVPIVVVTLLFGVYVAYAMGSSYPISPPAASTCSTHYNYDSMNPVSVLVVKSGSTGRICVEYSNDFGNSISSPSYISVQEYNSSGSYGVCPYCGFKVVTTQFGVSASPSNVSLDTSMNSTENEIVTYSISVPSDVTSGIYGIFLFQFCSLFPLVVVPSNASTVHLSASEFSSCYPHSGSCPAQVLSAKSLGVSGFSVVSLQNGNWGAVSISWHDNATDAYVIIVEKCEVLWNRIMTGQQEKRKSEGSELKLP